MAPSDNFDVVARFTADLIFLQPNQQKIVDTTQIKPNQTELLDSFVGENSTWFGLMSE